MTTNKHISKKSKKEEVRTSIVIRPKTEEFLKQLKKQGPVEVDIQFVSIGQVIDYIVDRYKKFYNKNERK